MFSEADAFLDAIFAAPDDDTPRLVYADWLEEHGQANYARFIRLQCAAARETFWSPEANRLWEQIGRVWNRLADEWWPATVEPWLMTMIDRLSGGAGRKPVKVLGLGLLDAVHFDRGLPRPGVEVTATQLRTCHGCWPWLPTPGMTLRVSHADGDLSGLASLQLLRRIGRISTASSREASNYRWLDPADLNVLLRSPYLSRLLSLDLGETWAVRSTVDLLLTAPNLASVEEIYISFHGPTECDREETLLQLRGRFKRVFEW